MSVVLAEAMKLYVAKSEQKQVSHRAKNLRKVLLEKKFEADIESMDMLDMLIGMAERCCEEEKHTSP